MASELIRYIGSNSTVAPQIQQLQGVNLPQQIDMTADAYEQTRQNVHQAYEQVRQAMAARSRRYAAEAEAYGRSQPASELTALSRTVVEGLSIYGQLETERKQLEVLEAQRALEEAEERRKAQISTDTALASTAITEELLNLESAIREQGLNEGTATTRRRIERILAVDFPNLPAEQRAELSRLYFGTLLDAEQAITRRQVEEANELRAAQEGERESMLRLGLTPRLAALSNQHLTPEQRQSVISTMVDDLQANTQDMNPIERSRIIGNVLETVYSQNLVGEDASQDLARYLQGVQMFGDFMQEAQNRGDLRDPNQAMLIARDMATRFGVPELADDWMGDTELMENYIREQTNLQRLGELQFEAQNRALAQQRPQYLNGIISVQAWRFANRASAQDMALYERARNNDPTVPDHVRAAAAMADRWKQQQEQFAAAMRRVGDARQEEQRIAVRRDPSLLGSTQSYLDTEAGRFRRTSIVDENGVLFLSPEVTEQHYRDVVQQRVFAEQEANRLLQEGLREGFNLSNPADDSRIRRIQAETEAISAELENVAPSQGNAFPNFNRGGLRVDAMPPVNPLRRLDDGTILPVASYHSDIVATSEYGMRRHPVRGGMRMHHGLDLSGGSLNSRDVGALTVAGGEVLRVFDWNGYGGTVLVRTPDGHVEQFSHLRTFSVREGDTIPPGASVGVIGGGRGDRMAGTSTGRHLHFQVWRPGTTSFGDPNTDTLDPREYLTNRPQIETSDFAASQLGAPPNQPPGMMQVPNTSGLPLWAQNWIAEYVRGRPYFTNTDTGVATPADSVFNSSNPIPQTQAPIQRSAYPTRNNPNANYGYQAIAGDPAFARELAALGDDFGFPAQWLADVMSMESTTDFRPNIENSIGAIGLIQAIPATYQALGLTRGEMLNMDRVTYMRRVVRPYLEEFRGKINTVEDLLAAIFGGNRLHARTPQQRASWGDGYITFRDYARILGNAVGRYYATSYGVGRRVAASRTHETPTPGCTTCQRMNNRMGYVIPHEGSS